MKETNRARGIVKPDTVYFHLTQRCNLKCVYCYISAGEKDATELSTSEIMDVLGDIAMLNPKKLVFTGGEPLYRKDVLELASEFKKLDKTNRIWLYMNTNGTLITSDIAYRLVEVFDEIRISLDGPEQINDALRGNGTFDSAMRAIDYIQEAGGDPTVSITISSRNLSTLREFMSFLLRVKWIHNIHLAPFKRSGRGKHLNELLCSHKDSEAMVDEFWHEYFGFHLKQKTNKNNPSLNCGVGKYLTIYPDGSVYPCHLLALPEFRLGNVKNSSLFEIFTQSKLMAEMRALDFRSIPHCAECFEELSNGEVCFGELYQQSYDIMTGVGDVLQLRDKVGE